MYSILGSLLVGLSFIVSLLASITYLLGVIQNKLAWIKRGSYELLAASLLMIVALLALSIAFLSNQFQLKYVAVHSSLDLPFYLKLSALWAGQEGSLLLWASLQAVIAAIIGLRGASGKDPLSTRAVIILGFIAVFFIGMTLIFSNPFMPSEKIPGDGQGINPLLRHPGMVLHPPVLYVGYVSLSVPFAFAMAGLIVNDVNRWYSKIRGWLLLSWFALGAGIILGARWAYDVLGWGGYWGWDAVENAGLMPWLTTTALLHGIANQKRGKGFKVWNITLASLSFVLVIFGTFTTRSGFIQSVHAFSQSINGWFFLGFLVLSLVFFLYVLVRFRKSFGELVFPDAVLSMEGAAFITLMLFVMLTLSILVGTLIPTLTNGRIVASPEWFNQVVGPQLGALVFVMGVCPLFGRLGRMIKQTKWFVIFPIFGFILAFVLAYINHFRNMTALIGFSLAGFAGGVALAEALTILVHRGNSSEKKSKFDLINFVGSDMFGSQFIHLGIVLMAVGVIGTQIYSIEKNVTLSPGESFSFGDYTMLYEEIDSIQNSDHRTTTAQLSLYKGTHYVGLIEPQIDYYQNYAQAVAVPAVVPFLSEDLYIVLFQSYSTGEASFNVTINPLIQFLWIGSGVLLIGGLLAWGKTSGKSDGNRNRRLKIFHTFRIMLIILIIVLIATQFFGNNFTQQRTTHHPYPGQSAPEFSAEDIAGNLISLKELQGKIVILHFWASWCPQCEEELKIFENTWRKNKTNGVEVIGVALQDDLNTVTQVASELALSFRLIADPESYVSNLYGVRAVPETFVIGEDGNIIGLYIGVVDQITLNEALNALIP